MISGYWPRLARQGDMTAAQAESQNDMAMLKQIRAQRAAALMREVELVARASTFVSSLQQ